LSRSPFLRQIANFDVYELASKMSTFTVQNLQDQYDMIFAIVEGQPRFNATHADLAITEIEAWRTGNITLANFKRRLRHAMETKYECICLDDFVETGKTLLDRRL